MNSYSRETLRAGTFKTANGPYGASRGNRVLQSKRVHGPSAQTLLCLAILREACGKCGIGDGTISVTRDGTIVRLCTDCFASAPTCFTPDDGKGRCPSHLRARW